MDIIEYYYWMLDAVLTLIGWHALAGRSTQQPESISAAWMLANVSTSTVQSCSRTPRDACHRPWSANHTRPA